MRLLDKIKSAWATNPILVLVAVALTISLLALVWGWLRIGFAYIVDSARAIGSGLTSDQAQSIASSIYSEVNAMFTNEADIIDLLVPLTLADYHKVKAKFGIVRYDATLDEFNFWGDHSNLTEVLNNTLSTNDKRKIKERNPYLPIG